MGARFRPNPRLRRELGRSPGVRRAVTDIAQGAAVHIRFATPRGPGPDGGAAAASIRVTQTAESVQIQSTDPFWHLIEWGSVNNPVYAPMRRGIRAAGLRLDESHL